MTDRLHLLPSNATPLERAVSETLDRTPEIGLGIDALHAFKFRPPVPGSVLPWLVIEYGLGPITPYLPDLATVIEYGVRWSRLKGTPQGIREAMSWLGYAYTTLYEAPTRRTRWHLFELELDRFWDAETDLDRIEAVVRLSEPARSPFWRGWREYNVRELEYGESRWGDAIWGDASGVRLHDGGVIWSFGRTHEPDGGVYDLTYAQLVDLGVWSMPAAGGSLGWGAFSWQTPGLTWTSGGDDAWYIALSAGLLSKTAWISIHRADGSVIGYRRARAWHAVEADFSGPYKAGSTRYSVAGDATNRLYVEAMTDFGEGDGEDAASWSVVLGGALPAGAKPGTMWLPGDTLVGGVKVGSFGMAGDTRFGKTARERCRGVLRMDSMAVFRNEPAPQLLGSGEGFAVDYLAGQAFVRDLDVAGNNMIGDPSALLDFARPSPATYFDAAGVMRTAAIDEMRFENDPRGVLLETTATNLLKNSQCNMGWQAVGTTPPTVAAQVPWLDQSATRITFKPAMSTGYANCRAIPGSASYLAQIENGKWYALSIYVCLSRPLVGGEAIFHYWTGATGTAGFTINAANSADFVGGFKRITVAGVMSASGSLYPVVYLSGSLATDLDVYVIKGQCEETSVASGSSYIAVPGTVPVTRAADELTIPLVKFPWRDGDGVLRLNGAAVAPVLNDDEDALDIAATCALAGITHLETIVYGL